MILMDDLIYLLTTVSGPGNLLFIIVLTTSRISAAVHVTGSLINELQNVSLHRSLRDLNRVRLR